MLKSWLHRIQKETDRPATESDLIPSSQQDSLNIRLDGRGLVIQCSGQLSRELSPAPAVAGRTLGDYLLAPAPLLQETPSAWSNQCLDLCFKRKNGQPLYTRGWLTQADAGWRLTLTDITDIVGKVSFYERKAQLLTYTMRIAEAMRSSRQLPELTRELLEGLALRLRIPCIAIALEDGNDGWSLYQHYCLPGTTPHWWDEYKIGPRLSKLDYSGPVLLSLDTASNASERLWAIPYRAQNRICAWLLCAGYHAAQEAPYLNSEEWTHIGAQITAPLLHRLQEQQHDQEVARYNALQQLQNVGWWEYDPQLELFHIAPHLLRTLALPATEAVSLSRWLELLAPADRGEFRIRLTEASAGKSFSQHVRLQIDGELRWYRLDMQAQIREQAPCLVGTLLDIQDLKQQQTEAQTANTRLESLVDSAPAIIYVQHYVEGALKPVFFSASLYSVLGWLPEQVQQESMAAFVHPDDRDTFYQCTHTLLTEGVASCRYRIRDKQHDYHWMLDEARLLRDQWGQPIEVVGLCIDITDATIATERLRDSEERYRVLVEDSPAMICRYRPDLTLTFANALLTRYLRVTQEQTQGVSLALYLSAEQLSAFRERLSTLTPLNPIANAEICLHLPDREPLWVVWAERGIFDDKGILCEVQAVGRDNSEVYKARLQLYQSTKMAMIGEMATTLAHEMNQPLNVMRIALVNLLRRMETQACSPEYIKNKLERIESQIVRASRIIEHMRIFGRRSALEKYPFDPQKAIEGALSLTRDTLEQSGIELTIKVVPLPQVCGHLDQLEQVLINLLVNARDALLQYKSQQPTLNPQVIISANCHDHSVQLQVEDNGGGIAPHQLPEIFEPFFTTKPAGQGTGLGLSVSHGIIQQMQGTLSVENTGKGALFTIVIPAEPQPTTTMLAKT
ncbi:PAS domain-containing sensor histidine kinase [Zobellella aerophila]|uniref:histidine kinase n=1 Tax=Zobellella aerophila TaxID=870480 RepID=A0ABP6VSE7_9GAMM